GIADRGHFYDPVGAMRDVVQNHLLQVLSLVAMEAPAGRALDSARAPTPGVTLDVARDRKRDVFLAMADADPANYVRGQYRGYLDVDGVAAGSQTETYCAMRLQNDNWGWAGGPVFLPARQTP